MKCKYLAVTRYERLTALHVHDNDILSDTHTMPLTMKIDFAKVVKALADIGYSGELTLEADNFIGRLPDSAAAAGIKLMYEVARYLADEIEKA